MSDEIVEYEILSALSDSKLSAKVNEYLKKGWKVYAAPFVDGAFYCQTMVKYGQFKEEVEE